MTMQYDQYLDEMPEITPISNIQMMRDQMPRTLIEAIGDARGFAMLLLRHAPDSDKARQITQILYHLRYRVLVLQGVHDHDSHAYANWYEKACPEMAAFMLGQTLMYQHQLDNLPKEVTEETDLLEVEMIPLDERSLDVTAEEPSQACEIERKFIQMDGEDIESELETVCEIDGPVSEDALDVVFDTNVITHAKCKKDGKKTVLNPLARGTRTPCSVVKRIEKVRDQIPVQQRDRCYLRKVSDNLTNWRNPTMSRKQLDLARLRVYSAPDRLIALSASMSRISAWKRDRNRFIPMTCKRSQLTFLQDVALRM